MNRKSRWIVTLLAVGLTVVALVGLYRSNLASRTTSTPKVEVKASEISPRLIGRWVSNPEDSKPIADEMTFLKDETASVVVKGEKAIYRFDCETTEDYFAKIQKETGKTWDKKTKEDFSHFFPASVTIVNLRLKGKQDITLAFEPIYGLLYFPFTQVFHRADGTSVVAK